MKYLKDRFRIRHINFYDDQFTFNRKRVEEFCHKILDNNLKMTLTWRNSHRFPVRLFMKKTTSLARLKRIGKRWIV